MNAHDIDDRIRLALRAQAEQVTEADLRPAVAPVGRSVVSRRTRWAMPLLAAAAVAAVAVGTTVAVRSMMADPAPPASTPTPTVTAPAPTDSPSPTPTQSATTKPSPSKDPGGTAPAPFVLGYQPLWPFGDHDAAEVWRKQHQVSGSQPWHLDADQTALSFTMGYLGFTEVNRVTSHVIDGDGAHIGVGYLNPSAQPHTAAVLHLVRFGSAADAPWEVVGSDDADFSIEQPQYGSNVSSPFTVGGHITGVDESIHIWVRQLGTAAPVGEHCCLSAGGDKSPWSQQISFTGSGVLTLAASTGGHLQGVERFAIHGVTTG
jgi:hypothetical protein